MCTELLYKYLFSEFWIITLHDMKRHFWFVILVEKLYSRFNVTIQQILKTNFVDLGVRGIGWKIWHFCSLLQNKSYHFNDSIFSFSVDMSIISIFKVLLRSLMSKSVSWLLIIASSIKLWMQLNQMNVRVPEESIKHAEHIKFVI